MKKYPHGITLAAVCNAIEAYKAHEDDVPETGIIKAFEVLLADSDLSDKLQALAAENAIMLKLLTDISENHVEYFSEGEGYMFAGVPLDYVSEINMYVSRDVNAENPFPATDAYLNSVRAEGIHFAANRILAAWDAGFIDDTPAQVHDITGAVLSALEFLPNTSPGEFKRDFADEIRSGIAAQLRAGKDGE